MQFTAYQELFRILMNAPDPAPPYDKPAYMNYVRLNWSRQQRWLKSGYLHPELNEIVAGTVIKQHWIIITEPWCGDAAHIIPFLQRLAAPNPMISIDYQLRDTEPSLIGHYLTRGARSIPKLIVRDAVEKDLVVWGPRPAGCQLVYDELLRVHADDEEKKIALQHWYNADKGVSLQQELIPLLRPL